MNYLFLSFAIIFEVVGTLSLKEGDGFTRLWPSVIAILGYVVSFYFLALAMRTLPVALIYATWSGAGIAMICAAGYFIYHEKPDMAAIVGMALIFAGVFVLNVISSFGSSSR